MKSGTKYTLLLVLFFLLVWAWKSLSFKEKPDEIVIDGIHTPIKPCLSVMNDIFGAGVDSNKACDCVIREFYEFVKYDSLELAKFKEIGFHELEGEKSKGVGLILEKCFRANMLDSNYRLHLTGMYLEGFRKKLHTWLDSQSLQIDYSKDSLVNCITDKVYGNLTVGEFIAPDYSKVDKFMTLFKQCIGQSKNRTK